MEQKSAIHVLSNKTENVKSLRDIAVESIREAIVSGHFKPGEHLRERELSEIMGISTTPIKEAFRILGHEGLVETVARKGTFVSDAVNSSIEEIVMLRANLEGLCARLAAMKISTEKLEELERTLSWMESLVQSNDAGKLATENTRFHMQIREAAQNPMIYNIVMNISNFDTAFRKRALQYNMEVEGGYAEHRAIFEAIQSRNPDLAEQRMKNHILRTADNVLKHLAGTNTN